MIHIYIDTCVISGYIKEDMKSSDLQSFKEIIKLAELGSIIIDTSTEARSEIEKLPQVYQSSHLDYYNSLNKLKGHVENWLDENKIQIENKDYTNLKNILKDENDAKHCFQAFQSGIDYFITVDYKTILNKSNELRNLGLRALSPSEFIASRST